MGVAMSSHRRRPKAATKAAKPYIWPPSCLPSNSNNFFSKAAKDLVAVSRRRPNVKTAGDPWPPLAAFVACHACGSKETALADRRQHEKRVTMDADRGTHSQLLDNSHTSS
jgi:hypothetical protein